MAIVLTEPEVLTPKEQKLSSDVQALVAQVPAEITSDDQRVSAIDIGRMLRGLMTEIDNNYDDLIADAHKAHKKLISRKNKFYQPVKEAYDRVERAISTFVEREEKKRQERERELQELARKQQEEALLAEAALLERQGDTEAANEIVQEAMTITPPVVVAQSTVSKVHGSYSRPLPWNVEIIDATKVRDEYWTPDIAAIEAIVRAKGPLAEAMIGKGSVRIWRGTKTIIRK